MSEAAPIQRMLRHWGIDLAGVLPESLAPGSPERSLARWVVADATGNRYILERLPAAAFDRKSTIARRLQQLAGHDLAVTPYCRQPDGRWLVQDNDCCWQVAPFVAGEALDRERYWDDRWRGRAMARWLIQLGEACDDWAMDETPFSLPAYIDELVAQVERHHPGHLATVAPIHDFLRRRLYPLLDRIPLGFCHGDPHPVNTIWGQDRIRTVIDWEFCGWKPILYDAALIVGCVGAESPEARDAGFIAAFMETLYRDARLGAQTLSLLPLMILAVRFGWLAEWLRRNDMEMIDFELFYMGLIKETCPPQ